MASFLNPSEILKQLKLRSNMVAADFGSGSGGWAIPLSKILEEGKVFAIDVLEEPLSALRTKSEIEKLFNIETIKSNVEEGTRLMKDSCDLVLMTNLLFEVENKKSLLEEGKRVLKPGGKILIIDWNKNVSFGPKGKEVLLEEIKNMAEEIGLKPEKGFKAGLYHWGLIVVK